MDIHKDNLIQDMLRNIPDPKMREQYGRLLSGKVVKMVLCLSEHCNGRPIATIDVNGKVTEMQPEESADGAYGLYSSGLEGSRIRLDGTLGFRCYCGNSSILLEEEQGVITNRPPSEQDLNTIALRLSKRTKIIIPEHIKAKKEGFSVQEVGHKS